MILKNIIKYFITRNNLTNEEIDNVLNYFKESLKINREYLLKILTIEKSNLLDKKNVLIKISQKLNNTSTDDPFSTNILKPLQYRKAFFKIDENVDKTPKSLIKFFIKKNDNEINYSYHKQHDDSSSLKNYKLDIANELEKHDSNHSYYSHYNHSIIKDLLKQLSLAKLKEILSNYKK